MPPDIEVDGFEKFEGEIREKDSVIRSINGMIYE